MRGGLVQASRRREPRNKQTILILSISLLFLVVACEINGDSALIGDVETDNKISELEKKIEVLERKTRHLTMISEINNELFNAPVPFEKNNITLHTHKIMNTNLNSTWWWTSRKTIRE